MTAMNPNRIPPAQQHLPYTPKIIGPAGKDWDDDDLKTVAVDQKDFEGVIYKPHDFETEVNFFKSTNMIWIPEKTLIDMYTIAGLVKDEVSWLGTVDRDEDGFTITEVFLPEQVVSGAETEMTNAGVAEVGQALIERAPDASLVNKLRFWCHTHPFGSTSPSGPDVVQTKKLLKNVDDFFIRGICNKKGKMEFTLYLIEEGIQILDCPWALKIEYLDSTMQHWLNQVNTTVKKKAWPVHNNNNWRGHGHFSGRVWCTKTARWIDKEKETWRIKYQCHLTDIDFKTANDLEKKIGKGKDLPNLVIFFPRLKGVSFKHDMGMSESLRLFESWCFNQPLYGDLQFEEFAAFFTEDSYVNGFPGEY